MLDKTMCIVGFKIDNSNPLVSELIVSNHWEISKISDIFQSQNSFFYQISC